MWEINNSLQLLSFFRSVALGVLLSFVYDFVKSARFTVNFSTVTVFLQDVIYSLISAFIVFVFLLSVTNGDLRGYVIVGIGIGFFIWRITVSRYFCKFLILLLKHGKKLIWRFSVGFYAVFDIVMEKIIKFWKKTLKTVKKLLKIPKEMLYTRGNRKV